MEPQDIVEKMGYKKRFLYGAFLVITVTTIVVSGIDYAIGNRIDAVIDFIYGSGAFVIYRLWFVPGRYERSALGLFWLSVVMELTYLTVHRVDFNIIFALLIPIIAFIALSKRTLLIQLGLYYAVLTLFLGYHYVVETNNPFLHRADYLVMYIAAHAFMIGYGVFYALTIDASIEQLAEANRAQKLLLREVHHRVKNNLNLIASIMGLQIAELHDPAMRKLMLQNQRRVESMALLHEAIYVQDRFGALELKRYIDRLVHYVVRGCTKQPPTIELSIIPVTVSIDALIYLGIMLHEMLTNSIKHAAENTPKIILVFEQRGEGYRLRYCDTNRADPEQIRQGFGYNLIALSAEYFGSTVVLSQTEEGLCYTIDFTDKEKLRCTPFVS
jgi:two-component sensor histidine kinase